ASLSPLCPYTTLFRSERGVNPVMARRVWSRSGLAGRSLAGRPIYCTYEQHCKHYNKIAGNMQHKIKRPVKTGPWKVTAEEIHYSTHRDSIYPARRRVCSTFVSACVIACVKMYPPV